MAFVEDLSVFLSDDEFGKPVNAGGVSGLGILDMLSEVIADGVVLTTDYELYPTSPGDGETWTDLNTGITWIYSTSTQKWTEQP